MRVTRTMGVLAGGLAIMLTVVIIRAESARIHYELSRLDQQEAALQLQRREDELEIARLKSPGLIRQRVAALRVPVDHPPKKAAEAKRRSGGR